MQDVGDGVKRPRLPIGMATTCILEGALRGALSSVRGLPWEDREDPALIEARRAVEAVRAFANGCMALSQGRALALAEISLTPGEPASGIETGSAEDDIDYEGLFPGMSIGVSVMRYEEPDYSQFAPRVVTGPPVPTDPGEA